MMNVMFGIDNGELRRVLGALPQAGLRRTVGALKKDGWFF